MTSDDNGDDGNKDQSPKKRRISYKGRANTRNLRNTTEKTTKIPKELQNIPSDNIRHGIRMGIAPAPAPTASSEWEHRAWLVTAPHIENNNCVLATSDDGSAQFPNYSTREVARRLRTSKKESRPARPSSIREFNATPPHDYPYPASTLGTHVNWPLPLHTGLRDGLFSNPASSSRDRLRSARRSSRLASSTNPLPERGSYGNRLATRNSSEPVTVTPEALPPRLSHPYAGATTLSQGSTTGYARSPQFSPQEEFANTSYPPDERSFAVESTNTTLPYLPTATPRGVVGTYPNAEPSIAPNQVSYYSTIGTSRFVDNWDPRLWQSNSPYAAPQVGASAFYPQPDVAGPHQLHEDGLAFADDVSHDWEQSGGYQHQVHGQVEPQPSSHQAFDSFPMASPNTPLPMARVDAALNTPSFGGQVGYNLYNLYWGPPSSPR